MESSENKIKIEALRNNINQVVLGKSDIVDLLITALISSGHVLLEDVPGVGKTTLAKALAKSINCAFKRIQFTPDLLPSDLTGIYFYDQKQSNFAFKKGPVFTNILLADEINRATPRTQSSLLECMEERQVTVEGESHRLDSPFFVIATQNPIENYGTFPLPEAQLDRFLMKIKMGYPQRTEESQLLEMFDKKNPLEDLEAACDGTAIAAMQHSFKTVHVDGDLKAYILDIIEATRSNDNIELGASPRASIALYKAAQAFAYVKGRAFVKPDDIIYLAPYILSHRIILKGLNRYKKSDAFDLIKDLVAEIAVPIEKLS